MATIRTVDRGSSSGPRPSNGTCESRGLEATLWQAADALRNNMDAAEYRDVVPGLAEAAT